MLGLLAASIRRIRLLTNDDSEEMVRQKVSVRRRRIRRVFAPRSPRSPKSRHRSVIVSARFRRHNQGVVLLASLGS